MGLDIFYIILGVIIVLVFGFVYKNKTKIKIKIPKFSKKPRGTSASTSTTASSGKNKRDKVEITNIISTVIIIIILLAAALWVVSWFRGCGRENKSNNTENYHNPSRQTTTTYHVATKSGTRVYMETAYWTACPVNKKEKIKAVSPIGETVVIELGVPTKTHFTAGWYTFYAVNKDKIEFWVEQ